jgi:YegS/Rv2252/BmrU family lipid kinase
MAEAGSARRALLIVNDRARRGGQAGAGAERLLAENGMRVHREACGSREALAAAIRRRAGAVDLAVIGGGDGTLNAALPALIETGLPLGILPLGTANDLARTLGIPVEVDAAVGVVAAGRTRAIDVGEVNGVPFFNVASLGLSERIARELSKDVKQTLGVLGYVVATIRTLAHMRPFAAEIVLGGTAQRVRSIQIAVGNGRYYGGGLTIAETAKIDDGTLDLYSLETGRLWKLAVIYPAFRLGRLATWNEVRTATCTEVEIRTRRPRPVNTDGEITTRTPARFRVLPRAVTVVAPEKAETTP